MLLIDFNFHALLRMRRQVKMRYDIYCIEVLLRCTGTSASLLSFTVIPVSLCFMHDLPWISLVANVFSTIVYISGQFTKYQSNVLDFFSNLYVLLNTYQLYHISCHIKAQFLSQVYRPTLFHSWCTIFTLYIARGYEYILRVYKLSGSKTFSLHQMHLYVAFKVASGISVCKHCDKVWNQSLP